MKTWPSFTALLLAGCQLVVPSGNVSSTTRDVSTFRSIATITGTSTVSVELSSDSRIVSGAL